MKRNRMVMLVMLVMLGTSAGCRRAKAPVNGIGPYELDNTTLGAVERDSRCFDKGAFFRCLAPGQAIAGKNATLELDFAGKEPSSRLVEIFLDVPGCHRRQLIEWFSKRVGKPTKVVGNYTFWQQQYVFLSAAEVDPSRCNVIAVPPSNSARIQELEALAAQTAP